MICKVILVLLVWKNLELDTVVFSQRSCKSLCLYYKINLCILDGESIFRTLTSAAASTGISLIESESYICPISYSAYFNKVCLSFLLPFQVPLAFLFHIFKFFFWHSRILMSTNLKLHFSWFHFTHTFSLDCDDILNLS